MKTNRVWIMIVLAVVVIGALAFQYTMNRTTEEFRWGRRGRRGYLNSARRFNNGLRRSRRSFLGRLASQASQANQANQQWYNLLDQYVAYEANRGNTTTFDNRAKIHEFVDKLVARFNNPQFPSPPMSVYNTVVPSSFGFPVSVKNNAAKETLAKFTKDDLDQAYFNASTELNSFHGLSTKDKRITRMVYVTSLSHAGIVRNSTAIY